MTAALIPMQVVPESPPPNDPNRNAIEVKMFQPGVSRFRSLMNKLDLSSRIRRFPSALKRISYENNAESCRKSVLSELKAIPGWIRNFCMASWALILGVVLIFWVGFSLFRAFWLLTSYLMAKLDVFQTVLAIFPVMATISVFIHAHVASPPTDDVYPSGWCTFAQWKKNAKNALREFSGLATPIVHYRYILLWSGFVIDENHLWGMAALMALAHFIYLCTYFWGNQIMRHRVLGGLLSIIDSSIILVYPKVLYSMQVDNTEDPHSLISRFLQEFWRFGSQRISPGFAFMLTNAIVKCYMTVRQLYFDRLALKRVNDLESAETTMEIGADNAPLNNMNDLENAETIEELTDSAALGNSNNARIPESMEVESSSPASSISQLQLLLQKLLSWKLCCICKPSWVHVRIIRLCLSFLLIIFLFVQWGRPSRTQIQSDENYTCLITTINVQDGRNCKLALMDLAGLPESEYDAVFSTIPNTVLGLHIRNMNATNIPQAVMFRLHQIYLRIENTTLSEFKEGIRLPTDPLLLDPMQLLSHISIDGSKLSKIPSLLSSLANLRSVSITNSLLSGDLKLDGFRAAEFMNFSGNAISSMSIPSGSLSLYFHTLDLSFNKITSMEFLKSIVLNKDKFWIKPKIYLQSNQIISMSPEIESYCEDGSCHLQGNPICDLPHKSEERKYCRDDQN